MLALTVTSESEGDLFIADGRAVSTGYDLETAVLLSLFLNDDNQESVESSGWWANAFGAGIRGSKLWLLESLPRSAASAKNAESYANEALKWLVDQKIVKSVSSLAQLSGANLTLLVSIVLKNSITVQLGPFQVN